MNKEEYFINEFNIEKTLLDDGAFIDGYVYSKDAFFEGVHFKREWLTLYQIAQKAMLVNISDAIAMNAKVKYALLSVAMPPTITKIELKELAKGFNDIANQYNIKIIGGDTLSNIKLDITITLISQSSNPKYRVGLKDNDFLAYTGSIGKVQKDLKKLLQNKNINPNSKFITPQLRDGFFYKVAKYINVSIDISDGLFVELGRVSKINSKGFSFLYKFDKNIGCSGEEYELLFSFNPKYKRVILNIAKQYRVDINIFAKVTRGHFRHRCLNHHF